MQEPAGELSVAAGGTAAATGARSQRRRPAVDELEVPEFIPNL